jgi:hypothetical protein
MLLPLLITSTSNDTMTPTTMDNSNTGIPASTNTFLKD